MRILLISGRRPYNFLNNFKNNFLPAGQSKNNLEDNLYITALFYCFCAFSVCFLSFGCEHFVVVDRDVAATNN